MATAPAKIEPKKLVVTAVFGKMVDPLTFEVYDFKPTEVVRPSGWVTSQIEAGKLLAV